MREDVHKVPTRHILILCRVDEGRVEAPLKADLVVGEAALLHSAVDHKHRELLLRAGVRPVGERVPLVELPIDL